MPQPTGTPPTMANLTPELEQIVSRWQTLDRKDQDELYATEFVGPFARLFRELPLYGAPEGFSRPRALVSVLGLSWQPVALMAAWARPERMLVIGTRQSLGKRVAGEGVLSLISRVSGVDRDAIVQRQVSDPGEADIYRAVRDFLRDSGIAGRQIFVDPTGGKKSMSASASLAGFLAGAPLVYVDYGEYHGAHRIPVAGSEYPRLLANPLEVLGDLELRLIFGAFDRSDFVEAQNLAAHLAERLYEPREAECLELLARGYGAWDHFDFATARSLLRDGADMLRRFAARGQWRWAPAVTGVLRQNLDALDALVPVGAGETPSSLAGGAPLLCWYLAAARRLLAAEKTSLALLLTYAAVERYVDLCLWVDFGLHDEHPDYALIEDRLDRDALHQAGRRIFGKSYQPRPLEGPIMFGNGLQLLAALSPERLPPEHLGPLRGLSTDRNKCEFEHGLTPRTPPGEKIESYLERAAVIIAGAFDSRDELEALVSRLQFPRLLQQPASERPPA